MNSEIIEAIRDCFISANVSDSNGEQANLVDTTDDISSALNYISISIDSTAKEMKRIADALFLIADK